MLIQIDEILMRLKTSLLLILLALCPLILPAQDKIVRYHAQGKGYYPMMVTVSDSKTSKPISQAKIKMELDKRLLLSNSYEKGLEGLSEPFQSIERNFYDIQSTNTMGLASLFYFASFSDHSGKAMFIYRIGTVRIEADGYKSTSINISNYKPGKVYGLGDVYQLNVSLDPN